TVRWARARGLALEPWLITWEERPLTIFGDAAAASVAELLADAGVRLWTAAFAETVEDGRVWVSLEGGLPVDLAIALPRLGAPATCGVPRGSRRRWSRTALGGRRTRSRAVSSRPTSPLTPNCSSTPAPSRDDRDPRHTADQNPLSVPPTAERRPGAA